MIVATFGGVTIGLLILGRFLTDWWPGIKTFRSKPQEAAAGLLPFLLAWCYGALAILGVGGLIGWAADTTLWITNWLGDAALVWGVGGQVGTTGSRPPFLPLTQQGGGIVLILTGVLVAAIKRKKTPDYMKRELKLGAWCGVGLATSAGVAGFAAVPLAQGVNAVGEQLYGVLA
ncbi:hypothetical protein ACIQ9R_37505 [Streptomyces sp. NPDC094447]|uniref:hypothetical protein n=1 Tax=Streptomyces sp. NPDC094447 TaxID=3366062 RepID=UPI0038163A21